MHESLELVCNALDELSDFILGSYADNKTLREVYGWHHPSMTRHDIAELSSVLADRIREASLDSIPDELQERLIDVPRRLKLLHKDTVPHMFDGNGHQAIPAYTATIDWLSRILEPVLGWQTFSDNKSMPVQLAKRLRGLQADIDSLVPNKEMLAGQIKLIRETTETAESFPADMQLLIERRKDVHRLSEEATKLYGLIEQKSTDATEKLKSITSQHVEAEKLVRQCGEAYRITTSEGLSAAFSKRASSFSVSMWIWVVGLMIALASGAYLGSQRIELLSTAITSENPKWEIVWMHIALSFLSIGAPLWFAWLATKQIGQRFRLSEDYGFKASVAKAYEGYRREAANIDKAFEARLFSSALSRLEEAPLRFVEKDTHGSPWHELVSSECFRKAMDVIPELKDKFMDITTWMVEKPSSHQTPAAPSSDKPTE